MPSRPEMKHVLGRSLRRLCPKCGRGSLMASYLKQVQACPACGEAFGHIRADDAPPWATILVTGHIIVPLAYEVELLTAWPIWIAMLVWPTVALGLALAVLPRAKAMFVGIIWATRAPGSER